MIPPGPAWLKETPGGVELQLHVQPRAPRTRAVGAHGDALRLQVAAPPVDGEANAEICAFLFRALGVRREQVDLAAGATGRRKRVGISGVTAAAAAEALAPAGG